MSRELRGRQYLMVGSQLWGPLGNRLHRPVRVDLAGLDVPFAACKMGDYCYDRSPSVNPELRWPSHPGVNFSTSCAPAFGVCSSQRARRHWLLIA
jgi:hypothetical protein